MERSVVGLGGVAGWATYAHVGGKHAGCDDEVGKDEAGHAEGEEDWFTGVCVLRHVSEQAVIQGG